MSVPRPVRLLVVGAGSRAWVYAETLDLLLPEIPAEIVAVADPDESRRHLFGSTFIWSHEARNRHRRLSGLPQIKADNTANSTTAHQAESVGPAVGESFQSWDDSADFFSDPEHRDRIDAVLVCVLDHLHRPAVDRFWRMSVHVFCEKPLVTTVADLQYIWHLVRSPSPTGLPINHVSTDRDGMVVKDPPVSDIDGRPGRIFSIGHVLRYSPHNRLLYKLAIVDKNIGDILSVEHTEPVGHWHFAHSFVRGKWRRADCSAASLLTKSCHDIDFLLWILGAGDHPPARVVSVGRSLFFRRNRKPDIAGESTNCLSCPAERDCVFSADRLYVRQGLDVGNTDWPVNVVVPDIEDILQTSGPAVARARLIAELERDYNVDTAAETVRANNWFGRCVWESDNDVCDDQVVAIEWDDIDNAVDGRLAGLGDRKAKSAQFHLIAATERMCERRGRIYGTKGEMEYDSRSITVHTFESGSSIRHEPPVEGSHLGADVGMMRHLLRAIAAAKASSCPSVAETAQQTHLGCSIDDIVQSHALVFAAEESRRDGKVVELADWWARNMDCPVAA